VAVSSARRSSPACTSCTSDRPFHPPVRQRHLALDHIGAIGMDREAGVAHRQVQALPADDPAQRRSHAGRDDRRKRPTMHGRSGTCARGSPWS